MKPKFYLKKDPKSGLYEIRKKVDNNEIILEFNIKPKDKDIIVNILQSFTESEVKCYDD